MALHKLDLIFSVFIIYTPPPGLSLRESEDKVHCHRSVGYDLFYILDITMLLYTDCCYLFSINLQTTIKTGWKKCYSRRLYAIAGQFYSE